MIEAVFDPRKTDAASVKGATQYDTGQRVILYGLPGPEELTDMDDLLSGESVTVQVQYGYRGDAQTEPRVAAWDEERGGWLADVPNAYLERNEAVNVYVHVGYGATEESSRGKTLYTATFTPRSRPAPTGDVTQDQLNAWDSLVGEVNLAIAGANEAASGANAAAATAADAAAAAQNAAARVDNAVETATQAAQSANAAAGSVDTAIAGANAAAERLNAMNPVRTINGEMPDSAGNLNVIPGVKWTKLWENASPSSEFPAQTISVSMSGYDTIAVMCMPSAGDKPADVKLMQIGEAHADTLTTGWFLALNTEYNDPFCIQRRASVSPGSIDFQDASRQTFATAGKWTTVNQYFVPVQIWGATIWKEEA